MARIMVVDDERDVVTLIKFLLEKDGHQITEAYNGADGLAKLGVEPKAEGVTLPELIIMDVIPLIILTAKGQMRELFEMAPNVAAYLEKPFDPKNLRELVTGMLAGNR
jgi:CheY-like chemotaxis protein